MSAGPITPATEQSTPPSEMEADSRRSGTNEAVIFLHLPKTAGTTVNRLIEWEYRLSEMYSIDPVLFEWSAAHLRKLTRDRLKKIRMFKGHMLFGLHEVLPQPATYITVLRDPVDRVISAFYFMRSSTRSIGSSAVKIGRWKTLSAAPSGTTCNPRSWPEPTTTCLAPVKSSIRPSTIFATTSAL